MRYHEIASGFRVPISGEEQALVKRISAEGTPETDLSDERDQEVARGLLRRGVLDTKRDSEGRTVYYRSTMNNLWLDRNF